MRSGTWDPKWIPGAFRYRGPSQRWLHIASLLHKVDASCTSVSADVTSARALWAGCNVGPQLAIRVVGPRRCGGWGAVVCFDGARGTSCWSDLGPRRAAAGRLPAARGTVASSGVGWDSCQPAPRTAACVRARRATIKAPGCSGRAVTRRAGHDTSSRTLRGRGRPGTRVMRRSPASRRRLDSWAV